MTEQEFQDLLHEALFLYAAEGGIIDGIRTYEQEHYLSTHNGLMVRLKNGEVFNLMVLKEVSDSPAEGDEVSRRAGDGTYL
jgi:hypothetical protein